VAKTFSSTIYLEEEANFNLSRGERGGAENTSSHLPRGSLLFFTQEMAQTTDDEVVESPSRQSVVRFADESDANGDSVTIVQSIGQGHITQQHQDPSSWNDINAFIDQSRAEQTALLARIEALETTSQGEGFCTYTENDTLQLGENDDRYKDETKAPLSKKRSSILRRKAKPWKYQKFPLPESTYTLLITERILSMPFVVGIIAVVVSLMCLSITLKNELGNKKDGNPYGLPAGVPTEVRIAQFLGIIIGKY
jgi:hypothetical protein